MNCVKCYWAPHMKKNNQRLSQRRERQEGAETGKVEDGPLENRSCLSFCPAG